MNEVNERMIAKPKAKEQARRHTDRGGLNSADIKITS